MVTFHVFQVIQTNHELVRVRWNKEMETNLSLLYMQDIYVGFLSAALLLRTQTYLKDQKLLLRLENFGQIINSNLRWNRRLVDVALKGA